MAFELVPVYTCTGTSPITDSQERPMAKVTVEDCLAVVPNRFNLVLVATARARELQRGHQSVLPPRAHEKSTVTALREIASGLLSPEKLKQLGSR